MKSIAKTVVVVACVLVSNFPSRAIPVAAAHEAWYGRGSMGSGTPHEMMRSREGTRPWFSRGRDHGTRPVRLMLRWRNQLELSPEQVRALREHRGAFQREAIARTSELKLAAVDLRGLLEHDSPDLTKVEDLVKKIALLRADHRLAGIKMIQASKAVLTPAQQEKFKQLARASWTEHRRRQ